MDKPQNEQQQPNEDATLLVDKPYEPPTRLDEFDQPMEFTCTQCKCVRISVVKHEVGNHTWMCCCCLCVFTVILGLLPFYLKDCKDTIHICPACSTQVGRKNFKAC